MENQNSQVEMDQDVINLAKAIRQKESGGDFNAKGDNGTSYGAYQWQKSTWQDHAQQILGNKDAEPTPSNQNAVAYGVIKKWKDEEGLNPAQIAAKWNSGSPNGWENKIGYNKRIGVNYNVPQYVKDVTDTYHKFKNETSGTNNEVITEQTTEPTTTEQDQSQDNKKTGLGGIIQSIARSAVSPFARIAATGLNTIENIPNVLKGSKEAPLPGETIEQYTKRTQPELDIVSQKPLNLGGYLGSFNPLKGGDVSAKEQLKDIAGVGTEAAFNVLPVGETYQGAKVLSKGGLVGNSLLKNAGKNALEGATIGAGTATGQSLQDNSSVPQTISNIASGAIGGGILGGGLGIAGNAISKIPLVQKEIIKRGGPTIEENISKQVSNKIKSDLTKISDKYSTLNKIVENARQKGNDPLSLISQTDYLKNAVDSDGHITTLGEGGAREIFYDKEIAPIENVITANLQKEGTKLPLGLVEKKMVESINSSGLRGAAKKRALNNIKDEIDGLSLDADKDGYIPLTELQLAKIDKYRNINFMDPQSKMYDKTIAKTYKELIGKYTKGIDVDKINNELGQRLEALKFIEKLDGKKVEGGKLGKYFAQLTGGLIGSHFGPLGSAVGAEVASNLKGKAMKSILKGKGAGLKISPEMEQAVARGAKTIIPLGPKS